MIGLSGLAALGLIGALVAAAISELLHQRTADAQRRHQSLLDKIETANVRMRELAEELDEVRQSESNLRKSAETGTKSQGASSRDD